VNLQFLYLEQRLHCRADQEGLAIFPDRFLDLVLVLVEIHPYSCISFRIREVHSFVYFYGFRGRIAQPL